MYFWCFHELKIHLTLFHQSSCNFTWYFVNIQAVFFALCLKSLEVNFKNYFYVFLVLFWMMLSNLKGFLGILFIYTLKNYMCWCISVMYYLDIPRTSRSGFTYFMPLIPFSTLWRPQRSLTWNRLGNFSAVAVVFLIQVSITFKHFDLKRLL